MKRLAVFFFFDQDGIADSYVDYFLADLAKNADRLMIVCNGILTAGSRTLLTKHTQDGDLNFAYADGGRSGPSPQQSEGTGT